jgi:hypothetical protein
LTPNVSKRGSEKRIRRWLYFTAGGVYGTGAVTVFEFPWLLERVTETEVTAWGLPETVKGWVKVNWLP